MKALSVDFPESVRWAIGKLNAAGYEAWAVGGCVRDSVLGKQPHDWDMTTSALPEETMAVFEGCPVIETGLNNAGSTEVTGGLKGGETLVTSGQAYLTEGCTVRVVG